MRGTQLGRLVVNSVTRPYLRDGKGPLGTDDDGGFVKNPLHSTRRSGTSFDRGLESLFNVLDGSGTLPSYL